MKAPASDTFNITSDRLSRFLVRISVYKRQRYVGCAPDLAAARLLHDEAQFWLHKFGHIDTPFYHTPNFVEDMPTKGFPVKVPDDSTFGLLLETLAQEKTQHEAPGPAVSTPIVTGSKVPRSSARDTVAAAFDMYAAEPTRRNFDRLTLVILAMVPLPSSPDVYVIASPTGIPPGQGTICGDSSVLG